MKKYLFLLSLVVMAAACSRLPDEEVILNDVKRQKLTDYKDSLDVLKKVENARIKRLEKLFASSDVDRDELKGYFQRRDFDDELRVYSDQIDSMRVLSLRRMGRKIEGVAEYQNNYGSRFQVKFGYKRSSNGWVFLRSAEEDTVFLSPEEKKEYLKTKLTIAIAQFCNDANHFPHSLKELVPRYITSIPPLDWRYDPQTGTLQLS
jgi:hypothetical protein